MNPFIVLTTTKQRQVRVNIKHISFYEIEEPQQWNDYKKNTFIVLNKATLRVLESPEEIDQKIKDLYKEN